MDKQMEEKIRQIVREELAMYKEKETVSKRATSHPLGDSENGVFISGRGISNPQ